MNSRVSKLVLAAVLATTIPAAAAARDCDHDDDRDERPAYPAYPAAPAYPPAAYPQPGYPGAPYTWREGRWRERELAQLRAEFRALDDQRARFYAMNGPYLRPRQVRRFERWYAARRAELEARWQAAQHQYAWR